MNKSNIVDRIFTSILFPPIIFLIIYFGRSEHALLPCIIITIVSIISSFEMRNLLYSKNEKKLIPFWLPSSLIISQYISVCLGKQAITEGTLIALFILLFISEIKIGEKDAPLFSQSMSRLSKMSLLIIYPNYLMTYWIRIINLNENGHLLFLFMIVLVFANDISCYCVGMLFGKRSRNIFKVSPKKSLVGFIGGAVITPIIGYVYTNIFQSVGVFFKNTQTVIALSVLMAVVADIGDLIESVMKRSVGVKDSGYAIPGRGGLLDSIDSILPSAIIFFLFCNEGLKYL